MKIFSGKTDDHVVTQLTKHQGDILAYICSLMPGDSSVDDVLQRVNLVIWKKRNHYKNNTNFRAWAFSITRFEVRNFFRAHKKKSWLIYDDKLVQSLDGSMCSLMEETVNQDLRSALEACIGKLKSDERELIEQRYFSEQTLKAYCEALGRSVGGVKVKLFRIRAALRRCIDSRIITKDAALRP